MKKIFLSLFIFPSIIGFAQSKNESAIRKILGDQTNSWNRGDIESFMNSYWQNDSLVFIGKSGVTYGWDNTLNNYKKNYPDAATMGKLSFQIITIKKLSNVCYQIMGKWLLQRSISDLTGFYTLLFKKINGHWLIISDHSS